MLRNLLAVVLAPVVWGAVGIPVNQLLLEVFPEAREGAPPIAYLMIVLVASVGFSLVAGAASTLVARPDFPRIGLFAGLALLVVGLAEEISYWDQLPVWYHLAFLAMLIPAAMVGAGLVRRFRSAQR